MKLFSGVGFLFLMVKVKKRSYIVLPKLPGYQRNKSNFYLQFVAVSADITFHFPSYLERDKFQTGEKSGK